MNDALSGLAEASSWSIWAGVVGKGLVWAGIGFFLVSALLWIVAPRFPVAERVAKIGFVGGCLSLFATFATLALLFVKNQFQYEYVWEHASANTDLKYKIAGVWTAQQGSFLLWACTSALFGLLLMRSVGEYRRWFTVVYSGFLGTLCAILAYETPFNLISALQKVHGKILIPPDGNGMTPSLQNYWVVIHPPTIFTGFGALTVMAALAVAAMATGNVKAWIPIVRPWALFTTAILGLGISMGGLWAYETQGWGGFWAWDPVENVSFVPWLFTVAFAHGVIVQTTRAKWTSGNLLMGGLPFISFVFGTFLTRSGLLDKVSNHSFASMDKSALSLLLTFLVASSVGFVALYAIRGRKLAKAEVASDEVEAGVNRESMYRFGMMLMAMVAVVIALGMSWPMFMALRKGEGSKVEEWLYHLVVVWFFIPIMVLMAVAPFVSWKGMGRRELTNRLFSVICITLGLTGFAQMGLMAPTVGVHAVAGDTVAAPFGLRVPLTAWMMVLVFCCLFVAVANVWRIWELYRRAPLGLGGFVAHIGIAVLMGGLIVSRGYEQKETAFVRPGIPATALGYTLTFDGKTSQDPYDREGKVRFQVKSPDGDSFVALPGLYKYGPEDDPKDMVWPHVQRQLSHDVYLAMSPPEFKAWPEPVTFQPGENKTINGITVEYLRPAFKGQPGTRGFQMGADVRITAPDAHNERHQYVASPSLRIGEQGLDYDMPTVGTDFRIAMTRLDPKTRSAELMLFFSPPIYPVTLFYKPLTGLIWLGTGILTLGGLWAAVARRVRSPRRVPVAQAPTSPAHPNPDAPFPAPQS